MNSVYNTTEKMTITFDFILEEINKVMNIIYEDLGYYDINDMQGFSFNSRFKKVLGRTRRKGGDYTIQLNTNFIKVASLNKIKEVIAHECIHLVPGCWDHGKKFKEIAIKLRPYGYSITRTSTDEEYVKLRKEEKDRKIKYIPHCKNCGKNMKAYVKFTDRLKVIVEGNNKSSRFFTCPVCGSRNLEIMQINPNGSKYSLGGYREIKF